MQRMPPVFKAMLGSFFGRREGGPDKFCFVSNACFKITQNIHYLAVFDEQVGQYSHHGYEEAKLRDQKSQGHMLAVGVARTQLQAHCSLSRWWLLFSLIIEFVETGCK